MPATFMPSKCPTKNMLSTVQPLQRCVTRGHNSSCHRATSTLSHTRMPCTHSKHPFANTRHSPGDTTASCRSRSPKHSAHSMIIACQCFLCSFGGVGGAFVTFRLLPIRPSIAVGLHTTGQEHPPSQLPERFESNPDVHFPARPAVYQHRDFQGSPSLSHSQQQPLPAAFFGPPQHPPLLSAGSEVSLGGEEAHGVPAAGVPSALKSRLDVLPDA